MNDENNLPATNQTAAGSGEGGGTSDPTLEQAARSLAEIMRPVNPHNAVTEMILELHRCHQDDGNCEDLLFLQARLLNSMFNRLLLRGFQQDEAQSYNSEAVNLALRAQRQCRSSVDALSMVRDRMARKLEIELKACGNRRDNSWL